MRNALLFLVIAGVVLLTFTVLLPILSFVLVLVLAALAIGVVIYLAAPLLSKLPWFRDWIHVQQTAFGKTVRFGRTSFTSYGRRNPDPGSPYRDQAGRLDGDVIDVDAREIHDKD